MGARYPRTPRDMASNALDFGTPQATAWSQAPKARLDRLARMGVAGVRGSPCLGQGDAHARDQRGSEAPWMEGLRRCLCLVPVDPGTSGRERARGSSSVRGYSDGSATCRQRRGFQHALVTCVTVWERT